MSIERGHGLDRIADQVVDGDVLVGDAVDEAGVGAVLQQAPHQVRQQVLVRADRRVDAAGHVEAIGRDHLGVQVVAHAVQVLEFVAESAVAVARAADHGCAMRWIAAMVCALWVANIG